MKNRIAALSIAKSLLTHDGKIHDIATKELIKALEPLRSIFRKCEKAQQKFARGTAHYTRFQNLMKAMQVSVACLTEEIEKRNEMSR